MTYDGLKSCIMNSRLYTSENSICGENDCPADSFNGGETSFSSSKDAFRSFFSDRTMKRNHEETDEWSVPESPEHIYVKDRAAYTTQFSDVEAMKEKFAKLLLGEDVTGGRKGICSALAISNAITNLAASVFGELWKLEPYPKKVALSGKKKWIGYFRLPIIWLNWFLLNKVILMVRTLR